MNNVQTYTQAINYIFSRSSDKENFIPGIHLHRIQRFLEIVGNPQFSYPVVHIAGTSGKGSTTYLISKILYAYGLKVATHMSPNLVTLNEKFLINFREISNEKLVELVNWYITNEPIYESTNSEPLSFYELIIALVFKYFENEEADVAIIETSLGGRLDATNVVNSDISVLTSIGMDHMEYLGDTLEKITYEKMHILKPGSRSICGVTQPELQNMIIAHAKGLGTEVDILGREFSYNPINLNKENSTFDFKNLELNIRSIILSLLGDYQVHNASLSIQTCYSYLKTKGLFDPKKFELSVRSALISAKIKGRFDIIQTAPLIIMDGAHNEQKLSSFIASFNQLYNCPKIKLLYGTKSGNGLKTLADLNIKELYLSEFNRKYYSEITSLKNSEVLPKLKAILESKVKIKTYNDPTVAFSEFKNSLEPEDIGIVTGSLYLLGNIYEQFRDIFRSF